MDEMQPDRIRVLSVDDHELLREGIAVLMENEPDLLLVSQAASGREAGWGLAGMRERAARIGATLEISSDPGAGTTIELSIPHRLAFQAAR